MESDDEDDDLPESVDATISRWWRSLGADERARISSQNNIDGDLNPRSRVWCLSRLVANSSFDQMRHLCLMSDRSKCTL